MISRDVIWDLVYSLIDKDDQEQVVQFEGVKKWEQEIKDIVDKVEVVADDIQAKINKDREYLDNLEPDAYDEERGHNLV